MENFLRATATYLRTNVRIPVGEVEAIRHIIGVAETLEKKADELKEQKNADQDKQK